MILLDTNVLSEILRIEPTPAVVDWYSRQTPRSLFISSLTLAEMLSGTSVLPTGKRKTALSKSFAKNIRPQFEGRILPFDENAAERYADIQTAMRRAGRAISAIDCQIAAIASAHSFAVATRDVRPFEDAGIDVINPWIEV